MAGRGYKRRRAKPMRERLLVRSKRTEGGCLEWQGARDRWGYGQLKIGGRIENGGKLTLVHRVAYREFIGPIPEGMSVLHRCDNPACIEAAHLWLGTHQDNMDDMVAKGRAARGERNGNYKHGKRSQS